MRQLCLALAIAAFGCREQTITRVPQDAGLVCGENEKLLDGECRFACDRDTDCGIADRCNLLTGLCEPRPPRPDAGQPPSCTTGAERCSLDNKSVERCTNEGTWQGVQSCPVPNGFCLNERCLACQPGASWCDGANPSTVVACKDDGSATRTISCQSVATCQQGECRECAPGSPPRCSPDNKSVQICERRSDETLAWAWANAGDSFDGTCITKQCVASPAPARCVTPTCLPGTAQCKDSATRQLCSDQGAWTDQLCSSLPGFTQAAQCQNGVCVDECADAAKAKSYFGCEYWSAIQDNTMETFFKGGVTSGQGTADSNFAFVAANRSSSPATVEVWRHFGGSPQKVKTVTVPARTDPSSRGLLTFKVPWQSIGTSTADKSVSGLARYAYRVTSTRPITLYQFNPLEAAAPSNKSCSAAEGSTDSTCNEVAPANNPLNCNSLTPQLCGTCRTVGGAKKCHYNVYSNDASLLLPAHILGTSHVVVSLEHLGFAQNQNQPPSLEMGGHVTIVATQDNTQVVFKSSAVTAAGGSVPALAKGQTQTFTLNSYDVLQIATTHLGASYVECASNPYGGSPPSVCRIDNDLTGSVVTSDKPISVFGGSACMIKPYDRAACDHLEEQVFPFATWGKTFTAIKSHPLRLRNGNFATNSPPDHWKIVAACPISQCPTGTRITLSSPPPAGSVLAPNRCVTGSLATNDCQLLGGQHVEFKHSGSFTVTADYPVAVAQYFPGQGPAGFLGTDPDQGDPSMVLLPPQEQWRANYTVLAAPAIRDNYLAIAYDDAKVASIEVDGAAITGFSAIPGTTLKVKNHPVSVGVHTVNVISRPGQNPPPGAGVTVYGYDSYVSYGYTGGLDLGTIVSGIDPGG